MYAQPWPEPLAELIEMLKNLPGVGKRSAERMALSLYLWDPAKLDALAGNLASLHTRIHSCPECGNLSDAPDNGPCGICASPVRDRSIICVVEDVAQIHSLESAGVYKGVYHVLGGRIAPLEGKFPESLSIPRLETRVAAGGLREMILALSQDIEGQATAVYLANRFHGRGFAITRPARGLPAGSDLTYADSATIALALDARTSLNRPNEQEDAPR
jgi:recombination protein RecR